TPTSRIYCWSNKSWSSTGTTIYSSRLNPTYGTTCSSSSNPCRSSAPSSSAYRRIHRHGGPTSVPDLVAALNLPAARLPQLRRLMRMLAFSCIFTRQTSEAAAGGEEEDLYGLTPTSRLLVDDAGGRRSLAPFVRSMFDPVMMAPSLRLGDWFKEADGIATPFEALYGSNIWGLTSRNPEFNAAFNEGMAADGRFIMDVVVRKCGHVFCGLRSLVDVGGGTGAAARTIVEAFPDVKWSRDCRQTGPWNLSRAAFPLGTIDGPVDFVAGSMVERVPPADAVMLKWILHDWDDEVCVRILQKCKEAIPSREAGGKVIVVEQVIGSSPEEKSTEMQHFFDVWMMILTGGRERDEQEWCKIFTEAGFSDYKIAATLGLRSVIEKHGRVELLEQQIMEQYWVDDDLLIAAQSDLWNHLFVFLKSMSLKCAVELGIPDAIHRHGGPTSVPDLVAALNLPAARLPPLRRLMRMLAFSRLFTRQTSEATAGGEEEDLYGLTPTSRLLVDDAGGTRSLAPFVRSVFDPVLMAPSLRLGDWFKAADGIATPFEAVYGSDIWDVTSRNPEFNAAFNEGMAADGRFIMDVVVRKCGHVFCGLRSLVDVGGGTGAAARAIAEAFPGVTCAVLDLPQVVQGLPADGPWVLHDWDDEDCVRILRRCKEAIPPREAGGKVIVIEPVIGSSPEEKSTAAQLFIDMWMMIQAGGRERDELEWRKIFTKAGFSDYKIVATLGFRSVIEVYP
ncbi:Trans-resveratrol di-O-methyltransferase, partial [Ananas comosus]